MGRIQSMEVEVYNSSKVRVPVGLQGMIAVSISEAVRKAVGPLHTG